LYRRLHAALKNDGYFVLTDYFAPSTEDERAHFEELARLRREQQITDDALYHYDTPLTVEHEVKALRAGGFSEVSVLNRWENTCTILARK
ncbi:MAG: class I SAM-dependent methyltransferase, partial [Symbiobacterium sp.]